MPGPVHTGRVGRRPEGIGGGNQHGDAGGGKEAGEAAGQAPDLVLGAGQGSRQVKSEEGLLLAGGGEVAIPFADVTGARAERLAQVAGAGDGDLGQHGGVGGMAGADLALDGFVGFGGHGER